MLHIGSIIGIIAILVLLGAVALTLGKKESTESRVKAAPVCELAINLVKPTPTATPTVTITATATLTPTVTHTPTPPSSKCDVSFDLQDTAVCWFEPIKNVDHKYTVHALPSTGGPYYMQTDWYVAYPVPSTGIVHHYKVTTEPLEVGKTYSVFGDWPGINSYNPRPNTVEIHAGINVVNSNGDILRPVACSGGMDYYWTQYVVCN